MKPLSLLLELTFPEYRDRHIFTTKFRIALFVGFWFLYVFFLRDVLQLTLNISFLIITSFLITLVCYFNILHNRFIITSLILEMFADLTALTTVVYLTWGLESEYYTIYVFYCLAAGMFYNHYLAGIIAVFSWLSYVVFLSLSSWGIIPPLMVHRDGLGPLSMEMPYAKIILLALFLIFSVYGVKIAQYFSQRRERILKTRNRELLALQRMSSVIKGSISLERVIPELVLGVLEGLDYDACLLALFDEEANAIKCFVPSNNPLILRVEEFLGLSLNQLSFSLRGVEDSSVYKSLKDKKLIFRNHIYEIAEHVNINISRREFEQVEKEFEIRKTVGVPLVAENETIGVIFGFTKEPFVEEKWVRALETFANHAAMSIATIKLIDKLKRTNEELIHANQVKSEFLATMSHELRTPLTAIIGFSELLLEGVMGELTVEQKESVAEVFNNGNDLLSLINDLLDLAKVDSGKLRLNKVHFNFSGILERVARIVQPLIQKKGHELSMKVDKGMPSMTADEKRIQQVMLNLLGNAIKFTPDNGKIEIKASHYMLLSELPVNKGELDMLNNHFDSKKSVFFVSVKDNGVGIEESKLSCIFDMFEQVDSSISRSYEGSGLGLALVKQFLELHGGVIWVESEYGKGSEFKFILPG